MLAIIPARGGSKEVPRKNVRRIAGKPLLAHSVTAARQAASVDRVVVSTDDAEIAAIARRYGATVVERPADLSGDSEPSESALLHVLDHFRSEGAADPDLVVFLQCTSPIRQPGDVDRAVETLLESGADSLLSVSPSHRFLWRRGAFGPEPLNYDPRHRPFRDAQADYCVENGSIYVVRTPILRRLRNRLGGKVETYEMDYWSGFEIDTWEDLALCDWILERRGEGESERVQEKERGGARSVEECTPPVGFDSEERVDY